MKRVLGVAVVSGLLTASGCGGVAELDSSEIETVSRARSTVNAAVAGGSLDQAGEKRLEALMILCHEKPLAETGGDSVREIMTELTPELKTVKEVDPTFYKRMKRSADHGCD